MGTTNHTNGQKIGRRPRSSMLARPVPGLEECLQVPLRASLRGPSQTPSFIRFANEQYFACFPTFNFLAPNLIAPIRLIRG